MDWRQRILERARTLGRQTYESPHGIGIEFGDGCDVFWILPGEVTSTVSLRSDASPDAESLFAVYHDLDGVRDRSLHVIRHYLASKGIRLDRRRSGAWGVEMSGASSSISVGAYLTSVARDTRDVYEVVRTCFQGSWIGKAPSRKRVERYLNTAGPPPNERPISDDDTGETEPLLTSTITSVLGLMGVCKAIEHSENVTSAEQLKAAATPKGRIATTLSRLAERLPHTKAALDILKPGTLMVEFDDGQDAFEVNTRSRQLARRIAADGPAATGDALAEEFLALNEKRTRALCAIYQAAAARGWVQQRTGLPFFGVAYTTYLGRERREVSFQPAQPLTKLLGELTPVDALRRMFSDHPDFAEACVGALSELSPPELVELPEGLLAPTVLPATPPPLRALDDETVAEMDEFSEATLRDFLRQERTIWEYTNRAVYDPARDDWASLADWVRIAEQFVDEEWPHPMATLILLDAKDARGDAMARKYLGAGEPHHEVSDAEIEVAWRYRHALPHVARKWFAPQPYEDVPFVKERARLGDPVALRFVSADAAEDMMPSPDTVGSLPPPRLEQLHQDLLTWATTDYHWSGPDVEKLRIALKMGWRDVADTLPANPFMLAGLLTNERRADQFDEPGMLLARDFLLVWSALAPSPFLARLIATAHATDLVALAERASRDAGVGKPDDLKNIPSTVEIYRAWVAELRPALAIAWRRCRRINFLGAPEEA